MIALYRWGEDLVVVVMSLLICQLVAAVRLAKMSLSMMIQKSMLERVSLLAMDV